MHNPYKDTNLVVRYTTGTQGFIPLKYISEIVGNATGNQYAIIDKEELAQLKREAAQQTLFNYAALSSSTRKDLK
ncbi:hypothetical protein [uncultured Helicobacter sp.]|uniref:hypothetical protein n=1 Tax=uncultured Helicobacter sp. TaxID=175537 RepID=UPI00260CC722|nr:hypothetical protein [uncultured Helicobacter sp.]